MPDPYSASRPCATAIANQSFPVPLLTLDSVSLAYGHLPLFEAADLRVEAGERIALIGRNGDREVEPAEGGLGRSSSGRGRRLARAGPADRPARAGRAGRRRPRRSSTRWRTGLARSARSSPTTIAWRCGSPRPRTPRRSARLGELQHELEERDGWRLEQRVEIVLSRLSLPADRPMQELSGGWRRRALLGKALVSDPDLLLLDEPTNHLDIDAIQWLEDHLRGFAGALLFVTHDRAFLSTLATRIVELDRGTLTSWPGSYAQYLEKKAAALGAEAGALASPRQEAREGGSVAAAGGEGAAHPQRRARARPHGAARAARRLAGAERDGADGDRRDRHLGQARVRGRSRQQGARRQPRGSRLLAADPPRRSHRPHRPERVGQDDAAAAARGDAGARRGGGAPGHASADCVLRSAARGARSRADRRRHRQQRQRHRRRQRRVAARHRLPGRFPVSTRARAVAGEAALGRGAEPPACWRACSRGPPTCWCSTSRPTIWTSRRWSCSKSWSAPSTAPCCSSATTGRSWTTS